MQDARGAGRQGGRVIFLSVRVRGRFLDTATSLTTMHLHLLVLQECREHADGVGAATDASDDVVRQAARAVGEARVHMGLVEHLSAGLDADDRLQLTHNVREGMGPNGRADDVVCGADVGDPIPHRLVDGILQRLRATLRGHDLGAEHLHAEDVQGLALHVHGTHVDDALQAHERACRGGGHAVLAGARLGNDALLAQLLREQRLAQGVVDLVRAGVCELLTLKPELGAAEFLREVLREVEGCGAADELRAQAGDLFHEGGVVLRLVPGDAQLLVRLHERLGDVAAAELAAEVPSAVALRRGVHALLLGGGRSLIVGPDALQRAAGELQNQLFHGIKASGAAHGLDNLGAHHSTIRVLADGLDVAAFRHAKPNCSVDTLALRSLLHASHDRLNLRRDRVTGAGDAQDAHHVDEGVRERRGDFHALRCARGGDDGHQAEVVLNAHGVEIASLLGRQIDNDEAVDTHSGGLLAGLLNAILQEIVVVAHEDKGHNQALLACSLDEDEAVLQTRVLEKGNARGLLDGCTIGQWVRERHAELDDISTALLQREELIDSVLLLRIPGGGEGDEGGSAGSLALLEAVGDPRRRHGAEETKTL
mmetsp:Transcript_154688/g.494651  ORF Transcript_154688/g.494651 Transcript_154688/m.494651 type:complete len:595 (+) Transcript_154688:438-2222(+)